ncbi:hypothetical protein LXA43DRAFT_952713 [Ganoderma leucocontextum]|nr:hypothetical protein LXA43DRAFT_952713 [Ganoderma leucocontextum]
MVPSFQPSLPVPLPSESRLAVEAEAQSSEPPVTASVPSRPDPLDTQLLVIQLDPVAMVRNLDLDGEATRAAEELVTKTQKYLVAISMGLDLIFADSKWCRYMVLPVATSFRPACPELGITSDMVLPIPPNSAAGKTSTYSNDTDATEELQFNFPFGNCYFWVYSATLLRIHLRRGNDSFDITNAIKVPMSLESRLHALRRLRSSASGPFPPPSFIQSFDYYPIVPPDPFAYVDKSTWVAAAKAMAEEFTAPDLEDSDSEDSGESDSDDSESDSGSGSDGSNSDSGSGSDSDSEAVLGFLRLFNAFGLNDHDPVTGYTPLFHAWPEVDQHLQEGTIGSPAMLWREQHVISLIIREGLSRRASASAQENTN